MKSTFETIYDEVEYIHVYPVFGREHVLEGKACWCEPVHDMDHEELLIHNPEQ